MPRYFFDIDDGERETRDTIGQEFDNRESLKAAAVTELPHVARDELPDSDQRQFKVSVRDETGRYIFRATLTLRAEWLNGGF
jgi:hypothetical protein